MSTRLLLIISVCSFFLTATPSARAADASSLCQAAKLRAAAKHSACLLRAEARAVLTGHVVNTARCAAKFTEACALAETTYAQACPTLGDCAEYQSAASCAADSLPPTTASTTTTTTLVPPDGECPTDGSHGSCLTYDQHPACQGCCNQVAGDACETPCKEALESGACGNTTMNAQCAAAINAGGCAVACDCY
ncbi:MAG TPA: hypothetical protein VEC57_10120 [Candidatus Limnocylindrales bacterium]|nr:hypothetical protein [Candidatus Limnocylindrales bacterium]